MKKGILNIIFYICSILSVGAQSSIPDSTILKTVSLDSITVIGRMPKVKTSGSTTTIQVSNTVLAQMGTVVNMLSHTPGLHVGSEDIEVNGLGVPVYVLDGRVLNDPSVLLTLQAKNIKKIDIDKMPSAQYSPEGQPVVKITTIKHLSDCLFMNVGNHMKQTRKFTDVGFFNITGQINKISANLSYMGGKEGNMNKETYFRKIYRDDYIFESNQQRVIPINEQAHRISFSADYEIAPQHKLGLLYFYQFMDGKEQTEGSDYSGWLGNSKNKKINRKAKNIGNIHSASIQYSYSKKRHQFDFNQEIAIHSNKKVQTTYEESTVSQSNILSNNNNDYSILTTTANYRFPLPWEINTIAGVKYNHVISDSYTYSNAPGIMDGSYMNKMNVKESNPQAYISLAKRIGKVIIYPAIRYHYTYKQIDNLSGDNKETTKISEKFSSLCPIIKIQYQPSNDWMVSMNYRKTISQPQFPQINSGLIYVDSLLYKNSNPNIEAEIIDRISSSISWKNLTLNLRYTYRHKPIITVQEQIEKSSNIITSYAINFPKAEEFSIGIAYSKTFSKLQLSCEIESVFPQGEYFFNNNLHKSNLIAINGQINMNYAVTPNVYIFTDFTYQGRNEYLTCIQKAVSNWSLGTTASLFKGKMELYMALNDILGKANYNNVTYRYNNITNGTTGKNDIRGFELRVSYNLFNKPINVRVKRQNEEIIQRTL